MLLSASYSDLLEGHFGSPFYPYVTIGACATPARPNTR